MKKYHLILFVVLGNWFLAKAQAPGTLDSTFNGNGFLLEKIGGYSTSIQKLIVQPDDKLLVFGYAHDEEITFDPQHLFIARYNADGTPDYGFGTNGYYYQDSVYSIGLTAVITHDKKILSVGTGLYPNTITLSRLYPEGFLDTEFGQDGIAQYKGNFFNQNVDQVFELPDGRIIVTGEHIDLNEGNWRPFAVRFLANGSIDNSYGVDGETHIPFDGAANDIKINGGVLQPDGKVVLCGSVSAGATSTYEWIFFRLNEDGSIDDSFGVNGVSRINLGAQYFEDCYDIILLPNGKFLVGGSAQKHPGFHFTLIRLHSNGLQDMSFGLGGKTQVSVGCCYSEILGMVIQPDGKIVASGYTKVDDENLLFSVARFKANGAVDQTFGDQGRISFTFESQSYRQFATDVDLQSNGKIVLVGFTDEGTLSGTGILARINSGLLVNSFERQADAVVDPELFPNPVGEGKLTLQYVLPESTELSISLLEITGRTKEVLMTATEKAPGSHTAQFDLPESLPAGVYLLRLESPRGQNTLKFTKR